jgi:hypothetical protein
MLRVRLMASAAALGWSRGAMGSAWLHQYRRGSIYLEDPSDVDAYAELFDHLRARALGPDESRDLIQHLLGEPS